MEYIEEIKNGILKIYKTNPNIHIIVSRPHSKIIMAASPARIVGVYKNIFRIEECGVGKTLTHYTFQYSDVLIGQVRIEELESVLTKNLLNKK